MGPTLHTGGGRLRGARLAGFDPSTEAIASAETQTMQPWRGSLIAFSHHVPEVGAEGRIGKEGPLQISTRYPARIASVKSLMSSSAWL